MKDKRYTQATVTAGKTVDDTTTTEEIQLFNPDGSVFTPGGVSAVATVATAIGTAAKTTATPEPPANSFVAIKYTNGNSADSATVAFNGGSARAIKLGGTASLATKHTLAANGVGVYFFDGTVLNQLGVIS